MMDANGQPQYPWEVNWRGQTGAPPTSGAGTVGGAPSGGGGYDIPLPGESAGPPEGNLQFIPPPPGVNAAEWKKEMAKQGADKAILAQEKASGGMDFLHQARALQDLIDNAPEGAFGKWMGTEDWQKWVNAPIQAFGPGSMGEAAHQRMTSQEAIQSKIQGLVGAVMQARYGLMGRQNVQEFKSTRESLGNTMSASKDAASGALMNHGSEFAPSMNDAFDRGLFKGSLGNYDAKDLAYGVKIGMIDPKRFFPHMTYEQAKAAPKGTTFTADDGTLQVR